ncbi:antitoxin [Haloechinothrix halophila]|uniref:antitoxin n=1 Tax=Haloechinothrix halophila TaxID=1069073 RepID=UPI0004291121|nr:antitoxin [Haloechinothrix halophila]
MDLNDLSNKAKDAMNEHGDKLEGGVDKAAEFAKDKFGDHADTIDNAADKARDFLGGDDGGQQ